MSRRPSIYHLVWPDGGVGRNKVEVNVLSPSLSAPTLTYPTYTVQLHSCHELSQCQVGHNMQTHLPGRMCCSRFKSDG